MQSLKEAWRALTAAPVVSIMAVLSLSLGIGANSAMFSIVNSLMLRALPVERPDRLALVADDEPVPTWSYSVWEQINAHRDLFQDAGAWHGRPLNLAASGRADTVDALFVSGGFFSTLGVRGTLGRLFSPEDDRRGADPVAIISYDFWRRRYSGSPQAIGQGLTLNGHRHTIVGVTAAGFFGPEVGASFDIAIPFSSEPLIQGRESLIERRGASWVLIVVRQRDDLTLAQTLSALRGVQPEIRNATMPPEYGASAAREYLSRAFDLRPITRGLSSARRGYERPMLTLMVVVSLVLLIACANIANLLLARGTSRQHELSVRLALGASSARVVALFAAESLLIAGAGAVLGLLVASYGSRVLVGQLESSTRGFFLDVSLDWRVILFTSIIAICTAAIFGTAPAWHATRVSPNDALKRQGRTTAAAHAFSLTNLIVVAQVALSVVLVVAAGLFVRTFAAVSTRTIGLDRGRIALVRVESQVGLGDALARLALYERFRQAALGVPGVEAASISAMTPVNGQTWQMNLDLPDGPPLAESDRLVTANLIGADYFKTFGTRVIAGRVFTDRDGRDAPQVAIVNRAFVTKYLNGRSPINTRIRQAGYPGRPTVDREIVGWVDNVVYRNPREADVPTVYLPIAQRPQPPPIITVSVRTASENLPRMTEGIAAALARVDGLASFTGTLIDDQLKNAIVQERMVATLSGFFGGLALLLAALGLYGVTSYGVSRRRMEIGIRIALGSDPSRILRLVMQRVVFLVAAGTIAGIAISLWAAQFVTALLYGLEPRDPVTLASAVAVIAATSLLAAWLPARQASHLDPARVLSE